MTLRLDVLQALLQKETAQLFNHRKYLHTVLLIMTVILLIGPVVAATLLAITFDPSTVGASPWAAQGGSPDEIMSRQRVYTLFVMDMHDLAFSRAMVGILLMSGGLLGSTMVSSNAVLEREKRTLELLVALPVSLAEILVAKGLAALRLSSLIGLPLLLTALSWAVYLTVLDVSGALWLILIFIASNATSACLALMLGTFGKDLSIAGLITSLYQLVFTGALFFASLFLPSPHGYALVLTGELLIAAVAFSIAIRKLSFEHYLE